MLETTAGVCARVGLEARLWLPSACLTVVQHGYMDTDPAAGAAAGGAGGGGPCLVWARWECQDLRAVGSEKGFGGQEQHLLPAASGLLGQRRERLGGALVWMLTVERSK